jgi:hypothetical protein
VKPVLRGAAGAGLLSAVAAAGWAGVVLLLATVALLIGGVCWVLKDPGRSHRMNLLLRTWRTHR